MHMDRADPDDIFKYLHYACKSLPIPKLNQYMKNVRDKAGKVITRGEHISLERSLLQENKSVQTKTQS